MHAVAQFLDAGIIFTFNPKPSQIYNVGGLSGIERLNVKFYGSFLAMAATVLILPSEEERKHSEVLLGKY